MDKPFAAYEGEEPYVFVCYAHDDAETVYPEIVWLRDRGINIWYDEGISPGAEFPERLGNAILGASMVLFYVSPRSVDSRHCRDEVYFGLDRNTPLLTSYLEETELPAGLAMSTGTTQALMRYEMHANDYRLKLLTGIAALTGSADDAPAGAVPGEIPRTASLLARFGIPLSVIATIGIAAFAALEAKQFFDRQADITRVRNEMMPRIRELVEIAWRDTTEPYALAVDAEKVIPDDPELKAILEQVSLRIDIDSDPPAAGVSMKPYRYPGDDWTSLGTTPIEDVRVPIGIFRWRFEKTGFDTVSAAASTWDISLSGRDLLVPNNIHRTLDPTGTVPPGMVRVAGATTPHGVVNDFFIDRYEVTNADYLRFVLDGGYANRDYWRHDFVDEGAPLGWDEGIARFVDQTGRPGPSTWLGGTYPDGLAEHPVSGVSWYEAAAYAEYVGKSLPTSTHWGVARGEYSPLIRFPQLGGFALFAPFSNFAGTGTVPVGRMPGITAYGAYDLAGNVREWCANEAGIGRIVRGGSFDGNPYRFAEQSQAPAMFREPGYGFRTVVYPDGARGPDSVFARVIVRPSFDAYEHEVVSDEVFEVYLRQFDYDKTALNERRESVDDGAELWTLERISVDAAYGGEQLIINLFLPKNTEPPYQTVIYFPGSASAFQQSSEDLAEYYEFPVFLSFLVKTGRAVAYPVYQGTFERSSDMLLPIHLGDDTHAYTEYLIHLVKDFRRTVDYLESRPDTDGERLAYYGMSWGGILGGVIPAIETRPRTAIILAGGIYEAGLPEANALNYAPRITMPYLMLVGRFDTILGHESSARPLFDKVGTPDEHKLLKVYESDHIPPKSEYIAEILAWLDNYLGPVGSAGDPPAAVSGSD